MASVKHILTVVNHGPGDVDRVRPGVPNADCGLRGLRDQIRHAHRDPAVARRAAANAEREERIVPGYRRLSMGQPQQTKA